MFYVGNGDITNDEFNRRKKLASCYSRYKFLKDCIAEQVIPRSSPVHLKEGNHPFKRSARTYLEDACNDLSLKMAELKLSNTSNTHLPHHLIQTLKDMKEQQKIRLDRKLHQLIRDSNWQNIGNPELIHNISSKPLSNTEKEALSLGLKFDTGVKSKTRQALHHFSKNYLWSEKETEKGFHQGVALCYNALASKANATIPRRYIESLKSLGKDQSRVITGRDKGGGVIIMDRTEYDDKMTELLSDQRTYTTKHAGFIETTNNSFNKEARRILRRSERGKKMQYLLEGGSTCS